MLIYLLTNEINGKYYVGKTVSTSLNRYLSNVVSMALKGGNNRPLLHRAIRKYGSEAFLVEQLAECETNEQASMLERLWIIALNSRDNSTGYNLSVGGEGSLGCKHSIEVRHRWSLQRKGRPAWNKGISPSLAARQNMCISNAGEKNGFFGKTHSNKTREAVAVANSQRVWTEDARKNMSASVKAAKAKKRVAIF